MSANQEDERQRSKSKKKGIRVSLTPSKDEPSEVNSFQISRCTVRHISELPMIQSQSSNSKNFQQVHFTYQSPHPFSPIKNEPIVDSCEIKWPQTVNSVLRNDESWANSESKLQDTTRWYDKRLSPQSNMHENKQIRSSVFTVVEQISSKMTPQSKQNETTRANIYKNQNSQSSEDFYAKPEPKKVNTGREANPEIQKELSIIPQKTLETSHQLSNTYSNERRGVQTHGLEVSEANRANIHRNSEENIVNKSRVERLKIAEKKLLNIIKVCDHGL